MLTCLSIAQGGELDVSKLPPAAAGAVDFVKDIKPLLENNCLKCHGPEKAKGAFRLTTRENALKAGDNGVNIVPGASAKSTLIHLTARLVADGEMPPVGKGEPLTKAQVGILRAWIDQGAKWPADVTLQPPALETAAVDMKLPPAATLKIDFATHIKPIFAAHCLTCHGPEKQRHDLRLDVKAIALKGGMSGPCIVTGNSADSMLIQFVSGYPADLRMPREGQPLSAVQIGLLRAWIDQGAIWPDEHSVKVAAKGELWSLKPVAKAEVPPVKDQSWVRNPIDAFVLARLDAKNFKPAPPADRATLLRRLSYDLTGLPPTPAELDAFGADKTPDAIARAVDRLLASPHYGERMARHWLDVVRFAESNGYEFDKLREHAWRYRDYVIRSFNADKPYAQFIKEQLAGDALDKVTQETLTATGFIVAGPWDQSANMSASQLLRARAREEELEDMVSAVSQTFLGMTVNCARCHDHKFDPIPQRDYYRIKAAFEGVKHGDRAVLPPAELKAYQAEVDAAAARVTTIEKQLNALEKEVKAGVLQARGVDITPPVAPYARWTFDGDASDSVGTLHGTLGGAGKVANGRLRLLGGGFMKSEPLTKDIREKTLEAWVQLAVPEQPAADVLTLQNKAEDVFDAIGYSELQPALWSAGSEHAHRTKELNGPEETSGLSQLVHVAAVYAADNSIALYRNGVPYGAPYVPAGANGSLRTFKAKDAFIMLGPRKRGRAALMGEIEEARLYDRALSAAEIAASFRNSPPLLSAAELHNAWMPEKREQKKNLEAELAKTRAAVKGLPLPPTAYAGSLIQPPNTHVLLRGDVEKKKDVVAAGGLSAVKALPAEFGLAPDAPEAQRRLKLAEWIADARNPLTPRVLVNRLWHYHFGRGLIETPNDFGVNAGLPTHPELLEWLAAEFLASGGSIKHMHRLIVLSNTYQQAAVDNPEAAKVDSENRLLWRYPLRRMEAEAIRDAVLAVSGQLNPQREGPGFRMFETGTSARDKGSHTVVDRVGPEFERRTIYRMTVQSARDTLLDALDCPDPSTKTPARSVTTTPLQALGMMNNAFVQRQSAHMAERLQREAGAERGAQIELGFRLALGRPPTSGERTRFVAHAENFGLPAVCWILLNSSEFVYVR